LTDFSTNFIDTIVSWGSPLHGNFSAPTSGHLNSNEAICDGFTFQHGTQAVHARLRLVKKPNMGDMTKYAAASPDSEKFMFDVVAKCLNIVISRSFDGHVHQQSSNKFFVKAAWGNLYFASPKGNYHSHSLEVVHVYYYNVKPGMGNIILNFNLATSAFFRPILLNEFLADEETFPKKKLKEPLAKMRVHVESERVDKKDKDYESFNSENSRIKTIKELSSRDIEDTNFRKRVKGTDGRFVKLADGRYQTEGPDIKVIDHLLASEFIYLLSYLQCTDVSNLQSSSSPWPVSRQH
jgi:eukaryotic translation initiation factor 2C